MAYIRGLIKQLRAVFAKGATESDLDEELAFHIERETEKNVASGMSPEEARRRALLEFRGVERYKEEVRDARWTRVLEDAASDLRLAARSLARRPGFTLAATLTLALGIGGTTAVYSVVRSVLFEPLPYPESDRLVRLYMYDADDPSEDQYVSGVHFREYRDLAGFLDPVAALYTYDETGADLTTGDMPRRVRTLQVTPGYFRALGATPIAGRTLAADEDLGQPVAVLSASLASQLGEDGDPGGAVELDGRVHTVVGVLPAGWRDPLVGRVDVWVPEDMSSSFANVAGNHYLTIVARLAPGVTLEGARSEAAALDRRLAEKYPDVADQSRIRIRPLRDDLVSAARPTLLLLMVATALVLLIACVNVANLQMVRSLGRTRDMAVRSAMGAGHGRIARQLLAESLLIAAVGGAAGLLLALFGLDALLALGGDSVPRSAEVGLDAPVLLFAAGVTAAAGVAFGLIPALRLARTAPAETLRDATRGAAGSRRYTRIRGVLVAGQVALALVLLVGAATLAASVYRLSQVDLGFATEDVLTFEMNLPASRYDSVARARFHDDLTTRLSALPGVRSAAAISWPPAGGGAYSWGTHTHTGPMARNEEQQSDFAAGRQRIVSGDFFATLGIPLLEGRTFDERDVPGDSIPAAVISRRLAEFLFPGVSALGHEIHMGGVARRIVGVVEDVAETAEGQTAPTVYHLHRQFAERTWTMTYLVATEARPLAMLGEVRRAVAETDPRLVVHEPGTLEATLDAARGRRSFAFVLTAVFAALALALAVLGVYGVLAYLVGQRAREIGIRIALGAGRGEVARQIVARGLWVTGAGLVAGAAGALAGSRLLESLVFETEPADPLILAGAAGLLTLAAVGAAAIPALRAARVEPRIALAEE